MTRRLERVGDAVRRTIAELLLREVKDPRVGMVTLTRVRMSRDLRIAWVYFSVLGDEETRQRSLMGLRSAAGFIRSEVSHRLRLRVAPEIRFEFDPGPEDAARIARLLSDSGANEKNSNGA